MSGTSDDPEVTMKQRVAQHAAAMVEDGMLLGIGTGSTATLLVHALAERVQAGLRFTGVPTSEAIATLATSLGLHVATIDEQPRLDLAIDGADEVDPLLNLIKGGGGALLREKIVASAAERFVVIVDQSKLVDCLGRHWAVPVEVVPFGWVRTRGELQELGAEVSVREVEGHRFITDGGHYILDCRFGPISDPAALATSLKLATGVVDHGLFIAMASKVIVGRPHDVVVLERPS